MGNKADYEEKYKILKKEFENFTYIVSHDLNAPMRHVREFTKIFLEDIDGDLTENQKEALHFINEGITSSESMVEGLLAYSRLNTMQKSFAPFSSEHLFLYAKAGCKDLIEQKNAVLNLPSEFPEICGDLEQLHSLVGHLLENALKFSDNANPKIDINIKDQGGDYIFSIKDTGIGIAERYFEEIFQIFKQLDPNSSGIGLGLALAKRILERHNGKIWLESQEGQGSIFYFSLPKIEGE